LKDPKLKTPDRKNERVERLKEIINPAFDHTRVWPGPPWLPTGAGAQRPSSRNNYDSQFERVITKSNFDELKKMLRKKAG